MIFDRIRRHLANRVPDEDELDEARQAVTDSEQANRDANRQAAKAEHLAGRLEDERKHNKFADLIVEVLEHRR